MTATQTQPPPFTSKRLSLVAGVATEVCPPTNAHGVRIGNATSDDVQVGNSNDSSEYFIIAAGFRDEITLPVPRFNSYNRAFYLTAVADGTVVLTWF